MNIVLNMNFGFETKSGFPQEKEDSIKLFLPTYDAKLKMSNCTCTWYDMHSICTQEPIIGTQKEQLENTKEQ